MRRSCGLTYVFCDDMWQNIECGHCRFYVYRWILVLRKYHIIDMRASEANVYAYCWSYSRGELKHLSKIYYLQIEMKWWLKQENVSLYIEIRPVIELALRENGLQSILVVQFWCISRRSRSLKLMCIQIWAHKPY